MARTFEQIESWDFPADTDHWNAIRAADAYMRVRLGLGRRCHAGVFDTRGQIFEKTLTDAYREWEKEQNPLTSVVISYGDSTEDLYAQLHAQDLQEESDAMIMRPRLRITVNGIDAAEVRGIGMEAMDKAKRGIVMPVVEIPDVDSLVPTQVVRADPLPDVGEYLASESTPSRWDRVVHVLRDPWVVTIVGGVIVVLIAALLT